MKEKTVLIVAKEHTAIDFTPIYIFHATETIRKGDILRFDTAEKEITRIAIKADV